MIDKKHPRALPKTRTALPTMAKKARPPVTMTTPKKAGSLADGGGLTIRIPANAQAVLVAYVAPGIDYFYAEANSGDLSPLKETLDARGFR
jgi:hypothetical protein